MNQKGFAPILVLAGILILIAIGGGIYYWQQKQAEYKMLSRDDTIYHTQSNDLNSPNPNGKQCGYLSPKGEDTSCPTGYTCQNINPSNDAGGTCVKGNLSPTSSPIFSTSNITEEGNGKTFSYPIDERFSIDLDPKKHPLKDLETANCPIGDISNLDFNGPNSYPRGFQALQKGSCVIKNGDFSATIKIFDAPN